MLAAGKPFSFISYDWEKGSNSTETTTIMPDKTIIVAKVFQRSLKNCDLTTQKKYGLKAIEGRNLKHCVTGKKDHDLDLWLNYYLPSVELYYEQKPWLYANIIYAGRGLEQGFI